LFKSPRAFVFGEFNLEVQRAERWNWLILERQGRSRIKQISCTSNLNQPFEIE
jgi:hypothetical protein